MWRSGLSSRAELHILKPARDKVTRSLDNIVDWLLDSAPTHTSLRSITDGLVDKLREAGVPVERINLGVLAVHPEMGGYAVLWESGMEASFEVPVRREDMKHPTYTNSPIRFVVEENQPVDFDLTGPDIDASFPVLPEFRDKGFTHYLGFPVPYGDGPTPAILTLCTRDPSGFSPEVSAGLPSNLSGPRSADQRRGDPTPRTHCAQDLPRSSDQRAGPGGRDHPRPRRADPRSTLVLRSTRVHRDDG